jgi:hypothetical protein
LCEVCACVESEQWEPVEWDKDAGEGGSARKARESVQGRPRRECKKGQGGSARKAEQGVRERPRGRE